MNHTLSSVIFFFFGFHKKLYTSILILTLVGSALESLSVAAFFPMFSSILNSSDETPGGFLKYIDQAVGLVPIEDPVLAASALLVSIFIVKTIVSLTRDGLVAFASAKVLYSVRKKIMGRYAEADYQFFLDHKQGSLIYDALTAPGAVGSLMLKGPQVANALLRVIFISVVLALIFPWAALVFACLGAGYYGVNHILAKKISLKLGKGRADAGSEQAVVANEFLSGIHQIISLRATGSWIARFEEENKKHSEMYGKDLAWLAVPRPVMELFAIGLMVGFLVTLRVMTPDSFADSLPHFGIFAIALVQLLPSVSILGRSRMEMLGSLPTVELAYNAISGPMTLRKHGHREIESFKDSISFDDVIFTYSGRDTLLNHMNVKFEQGKVTALVGPSGSGKSTMVNLILGLFEPEEGDITVDGVPLHDIKGDSWLGKIGFVSQEAFIYHSSVADNIVFGRVGFSREEILKAATIANAHGFISELPEQYDTIVGERGMKLSGGQQQRIAIARAVLGDPEILMFDEATSSLDTVSEKLVQEAIDNVSANRTVILIAHRLSTVSGADKIIVLNQGKVTEQGNHSELITKGGEYSHMVAISNPQMPSV